LNSSKVWKDYKDQKHDLFLSSTTISGYLTGSAPVVAGYLTAGSSSNNTMSDKMPPVDHHNNNRDFSP
jgi:DnaJ family protein C protein 13